MLKYAKDKDVVSGVALMLFGVYVIAKASNWTLFDVNGPGPGFFPILYGLIMSASALALAFGAIKARRQEPDAPSEPVDRTGTVAAAATLAALAASVPLMWLLGFVVGFGLVLFFIIRFVFRRPTLGAGITAAAIVAALHLIFPVFLQSPLPTGLFWSF